MRRTYLRHTIRLFMLSLNSQSFDQEIYSFEQVRNTGGTDGSVVVLGFIAAIGRRPDDPIRELFGFEKVAVAALLNRGLYVPAQLTDLR